MTDNMQLKRRVDSFTAAFTNRNRLIELFGSHKIMDVKEIIEVKTLEVSNVSTAIMVTVQETWMQRVSKWLISFKLGKRSRCFIKSINRRKLDDSGFLNF